MFKDFLNSRLGVNGVPKSQAAYVEFGYGQVEPNHLSAQRTAQIYAQLPAAADIEILENGQFVKYDYAANDNGIGEVNFKGAGEWMLVYNEIKLYRDHPDGTKQWDCEFAMIKDDYQARIYSPYDWEHTEVEYGGRYWNGKDETNATSMTINQTVSADQGLKTVTIAGQVYDIVDNKFTYKGVEYALNPKTHQSVELVPVEYAYDEVLTNVPDIYEELTWTNDPYKKLGIYHEKRMTPGTAMVPRVFKTNLGDLYTTNMINETELAVGDTLSPSEATKGILSKNGDESMLWQVVKVYTMPDGQKGVKVMRIK
ncbi:MAG: hypothetical protein PUJ51_08600 [Clostridiales bacterium]|nr:hypothetical protein [Clostridiales bacterium]